jgi:hypothetical protein
MDKPLRVFVDFDTGGDPIAGSVSTGLGSEAFTGWLELISGLERALSGWVRPGAGGPGARPPVPGSEPDQLRPAP